MKSDNLKLVFAGDFCPSFRFEETLSKEFSFAPAILNHINAADVSFINLECVITDRTSPILKNGPNIKAGPNTLETLSCFDVACLANNHIFDYGLTGLNDTIEAAKNIGLDVVGCRSDKYEQSVYSTSIKGLNLKVFNFCEEEFNTDIFGASIIDPVSNYDLISKSINGDEFVVAILHCGNEYSKVPAPPIRDYCHFLIDIGVDLIVTHHPHVPGCMELYNDKYICYSLGNFLFDNQNTKKSEWEKGYLVHVDISTLTKEYSLEIVPYNQEFPIGPDTMTVDDSNEFFDTFTHFSEIVSDDKKYSDYFDNYINQKKFDYVAYASLPFFFPKMRLLFKSKFIRGILKPFMAKKLNLIRNYSHRFVLIESLKKILK